VARKDKQTYGSVSDLFGRSPWGGVLTAVLQGLDEAAGPQKRAVQQVSEFFSHFSRAAFEKFGAMLEHPRRCSMSGCQAEAVVLCMGCGEAACMAHLHVSHRAEGLCDQCVRDLLELKGREPRRPASKSPSSSDVKQARQTLGVRSGASWNEVQRAHRRAAAEHHPDRARTPSQRRAAEKKSKRINSAFEVLRRHYEQRERAA